MDARGFTIANFSPGRRNAVLHAVGDGIEELGEVYPFRRQHPLPLTGKLQYSFYEAIHFLGRGADEADGFRADPSPPQLSAASAVRQDIDLRIVR